MKKLIVLTLVCVLTAVTQAGVVGVTLNFVDTTYTAATQTFSMSDSGLLATLQHDDNTQSALTGISIELNTTYSAGMTFTGGTFVLSDAGGTLLAGNVIQIDFTAGATTLGGEGTAQVTNSNLAGFPEGLADLISITFNLAPAFTDFNQDYSGDTNISFQVPEPASLAMLGLGAVGLLRKRK